MSASGPFCPHCGTAVPAGARFCPACGRALAADDAPLESRPRPVRDERAPGTSGKAIAALALGIGGFLLFPIACSVAAILVGHAARRDIEADPELGGSGLATAGIILGWVGVVSVTLGLLLFLAAG